MVETPAAVVSNESLDSRPQSSPRVRADSTPLPTDSMVSVPLTDPDVLSSTPSTPALNAPSLNLVTESQGENTKRDCASSSEAPTVLQREATGSTVTPEGLGQTSRASQSSRRDSTVSAMSDTCDQLDWDELDRNEEQESQAENADESTAFLLARLEQENNALATNPKSGLKAARPRGESRPPSIHHLKKLVNDPNAPSLRYSLLPAPPPMTELEFWAALVADYPQTAQRLPTLTSNKIRSGIPPPLRGVVWASIAGARDKFLEEQYERLSGESSPYENLIGKDIGRSFPGVEMFRDPEGEGQRTLGRVLKCFSLYDHKIGYCQGLGFLVGPLLMHMGEKEAFCTLIRLMEHYDLRSCFLPDLSGLHLRIYQFQRLLNQNIPELFNHLERLQIEPGYVSQWFLSFFAVTCPLPMLLRIYDVIFAEGASETMMRVALSLMRRNESKILECAEYEDVMQLLLSRSLWDTYDFNADDLVNDFVGLTGIVTREVLQTLETSFKEEQSGDSASKTASFPDLQAAASRFLGRLWAGSNSSTKSALLTPGLSAPSRPVSFLRRTPSKQSIASTLNSVEAGSDSSTSTAPTEISAMSRQSSTETSSPKGNGPASLSMHGSRVSKSKDKDLHSQIEDLLMALSEMQKGEELLQRQIQREREEREEDRQVVRQLIQTLSADKISKDLETQQTVEEESDSVKLEEAESEEAEKDELPGLLKQVEQRFSLRTDPRRSSMLETKQQLRDELSRSREKYTLEAARSQELTRKLTEQDRENSRVKDELKEARSRLQDSYRDKQRLERTIQELKARSPSPARSHRSSDPVDASDSRSSMASGGLRELKLGRANSTRQTGTPTFSKRTSSLMTQTLLATENQQPAPEDALLVELVNAKTAEAVAKQELEEVKGKLESLRKMLGSGLKGGGGASNSNNLHRPSPSQPTLERSTTMSALSSYITAPVSNADAPKPTPASSAGGFWSGWGKRSVSTTVTSDAR